MFWFGFPHICAHFRCLKELLPFRIKAWFFFAVALSFFKKAGKDVPSLCLLGNGQLVAELLFIHLERHQLIIPFHLYFFLFLFHFLLLPLMLQTVDSEGFTRNIFFMDGHFGLFVGQERIRLRKQLFVKFDGIWGLRFILFYAWVASVGGFGPLCRWRFASMGLKEAPVQVGCFVNFDKEFPIVSTQFIIFT